MALATAHGSAAIAVLRLSGSGCWQLIEKVFRTRSLKNKTLNPAEAPGVSFGVIMNDNIIVDEVLVSFFKAPFSYTGQDVIEVSCHGSHYIQQQLLQLFLSLGARLAEPGEFTLRAFLNGKLDLSQAEAVADLVASNSPVSHHVAMQQMRGGFSAKIKALRNDLIDFASLIELELDFSEEDVEFADRSALLELVGRIRTVIGRLVESFDLGNVIRNGIPVSIVGRPNAGKSTLLNALLEDERAIVSDIPGTTRDTIEEAVVIGGVLFRFIDTAGLRVTTDEIEKRGVERAIQSMQRSSVVIYLFDVHAMGEGDLSRELGDLRKEIRGAQLIPVGNKSDLEDAAALKKEFAAQPDLIFISAKTQGNLEVLRNRLVELFDIRAMESTDSIVTNARHASALREANDALQKVEQGLGTGIPGDLLALDIRHALNALGDITGQVTSEDLLSNIFGRFCIGK